MRKLIISSCLLFFPWIGWPIPVHLSGWVTDEANIIEPSTRLKIEHLSSQLEEKTSAQLAVVTVSSLNGLPIEQVAVSLFNPNEAINKPGLGQKGKNNGVLLLIAPNDRHMRIEVGYGLEHIITDGIAGRIRDQIILPHFKTGNMNEGIWQGSAEIAFLIAKDAGVQLTDVAYTPRSNSSSQPSSNGGSILFFFIVLIIVLVMRNPWLGVFLLSGRGSHRGGYRSGGGFGGGFGGFGGGMSGGAGASGRW